MYFAFLTTLAYTILCVHGISAEAEDRVKVQLYYECLCPFSQIYYIEQLKPAVLKLLKYIDLETNPYGKAETSKNGDQYEFKCHHGPKECYGDKLQACTINILGNITQYVLYNACLMEGDMLHRGSDDDAADRCGKSLQVDPKPIKECAKGPKGSELLENYGKSRPIVNYEYVPYVIVNNTVIRDEDLQDAICRSLKSPPPECQSKKPVEETETVKLNEID